MTISRRRWWTKKVARSATMLGSWATGSLAVRRTLASGPAVRALIYHRFGRSLRDPFCVTSADFERQVRWIAERGLALSLEETLAFVRGERSAPDGAVLITMDDGFSSVATHAAPILEAHGVPAVAFVTTSLMDSPNVGGDEPYMSWDQVGSLFEHGFAVGSHAHTHSSLGRMPEERARQEGARSRELLQARLGREIDAFAYPYGMRLDHNAGTARVLREVGYRSVFIAQHGTLRPGLDLHCLPRVKVEGGDGALFRLLCRGGMDAWRAVDHAGYFLQRPE